MVYCAGVHSTLAAEQGGTENTTRADPDRKEKECCLYAQKEELLAYAPIAHDFFMFMQMSSLASSYPRITLYSIRI
jgi:hypothetical protein